LSIQRPPEKPPLFVSSNIIEKRIIPSQVPVQQSLTVHTLQAQHKTHSCFHFCHRSPLLWWTETIADIELLRQSIRPIFNSNDCGVRITSIALATEEYRKFITF
jgi:hypothetical protein